MDYYYPQIQILRSFGVNLFNLMDGRYFTLLSGTLLHANLTHILLNLVFLFYLGSILSRFLAWPKLLWIYLISGFGSSLLSVTLNDGNSIGASGAIFGLMGALMAISYQQSRQEAKSFLGLQAKRQIKSLKILLLMKL